MGERLVSESPTALTAPIAGLESAIWGEYDEPADTVHLRFDCAARGLDDGGSQQREAGVSEELRDDVEGHGGKRIFVVSAVRPSRDGWVRVDGERDAESHPCCGRRDRHGLSVDGDAIGLALRRTERAFDLSRVLDRHR